MRLSVLAALLLAATLAACSTDNRSFATSPAEPESAPVASPLFAKAAPAPAVVPVVIPSTAKSFCNGGSFTLGTTTFDVRASDTGPNATPFSGCLVSYDSATRGVYLTMNCDRKAKCTGAQIVSRDPVWFGVLETQISGPLNQLLPQVVVGAFTYPRKSYATEVVDGTREVDVVEWARWGSATAGNVNFTVWPNVLGLSHTSCEGALPAFTAPAAAPTTFTSRALWESNGVYFETFAGTSTAAIGSGPSTARRDWRYTPASSSLVPQTAAPFYFNLWRFGTSTTNLANYSVTILVSTFKYTPTLSALPNATAPMC